MTDVDEVNFPDESTLTFNTSGQLQVATGGLSDTHLSTGVYSSITGLGTQTQDLGMGGNNILLSGDNAKLKLGASNDAELFFNGTSVVMEYDALDAGTPEFQIKQNGVTHLSVDTNGDVQAFQKLRSDGQFIVDLTNTSAVDIRKDGGGATVFSIDTSNDVIDNHGNTVDNVGHLNTSSSTVASSGVIRLGSTEIIAWRDDDNTDDIQLKTNSINHLVLERQEGITVFNMINNVVSSDNTRINVLKMTGSNDNGGTILGSEIIQGLNSDVAGSESFELNFEVRDSANNMVEYMSLNKNDNARVRLQRETEFNNTGLTPANNIARFLDTDVAHGGISGSFGGDTVGRIEQSESGGRMLVEGLADSTVSTNVPMSIVGRAESNVDTTKSSSGRSLIEVISGQLDGSGSNSDVVTDGNVLGVRARVGGSFDSLMLLGEDGSMWVGGDSDVHYEAVTHSSISDGGKVQLVPNDATANAVVEVVDTTNNNVGVFYLKGSGNAVSEISDPDTVFTTTEDNDTTINVYWDGTNSQYELNNETGGPIDVKVFIRRI